MTSRSRDLFRSHADRRRPATPAARTGRRAGRLARGVLALAVGAASLAGLALNLDAPAAGALAIGDMSNAAGYVGSSNPSSFGTDPGSVLATSSAVYVADTANSVVRRYDRATHLVAIVAGNGTAANRGDGGAATAAGVNSPEGLALDSSGNLYISDVYTGVVRKVGTNGIISTVAGGGFPAGPGFGDGGPATAARLDYPRGIDVDADGNLFIADANHHRIRKVDTSGTITTVAGNGTDGFGGDGGTATGAQLSYPSDVKATTLGLYLADSGNQRIRRVPPNGKILTVAGTGTGAYSGDGGPATDAALWAPTRVWRDASGNLLIADSGNQRIRRVNLFGTISTVAGTGAAGFSGDGGSALTATFFSPQSVSVAPDGMIAIADRWNSRVRQVATNGNISTLMGNGNESTSGDGGAAIFAQLNRPRGMAVDAAGNLLFADSENNRVRKISPSGIITTIGGQEDFGYSGDGGPATSAELFQPQGIAVDVSGNIFVADTTNQRVRRIAPNGIITTVAGTGTAGYSGDGGPATNATINSPYGLATDKAGNLYIADLNNQAVRKVSTGGTITTVAGGNGTGHSGDGGPATVAKVQPIDVTISPAGDLLISDSTNRRIRRVSAGTITTIAGTGSFGNTGDGGPATAAGLDFPNGIRTDASGRLFVSTSSQIRVIELDGTIRTVAGTNVKGWSGDGGPALQATLTSPTYLAVANTGDLYIADSFNNRIRKVSGASSPTARFHPVAPTRILDSRTPNGGFNGPVGAGAGNVKSLQVGGAGGGVVPSTATAVAMNVTATEGTAGSFLTVYPTGGAVPTASNLNFAAGQTIPNQVTVRLNPDGAVSFFNAVGSVHVVADVVGYYDNGYDNTGDGFIGLTPTRILDSRTAVGGFNGPVAAGAPKNLTVSGVGGVSATAHGVVLNITVTGATTPSFLTAYPKGGAVPTASNLNFAAGQTISNLVIAKVGVGGQITVANQLGSVHVIADVVGYFGPTLSVSTGRFHPVVPTRILDDRNGTGGYNTPWGPGTNRAVAVAGVNGIPASAKAVVVNITATNGTAGSFLTAWPDGITQPGTSTLTFGPGQTIPNLAVVKLGANGKIAIANQLGSVDVVGDVVGYVADF